VPITALDIRAIVEKEDDFGHELRVGRILRGYGDGKLLHGGTYTDPITKKPRQYDFRLYYSANERAISLAVECKNVKSEAPVVISGRQRRREESVHDLEGHTVTFHMQPDNYADRLRFEGSSRFEADGVKSVLTAASLTYVAAVAQALVLLGPAEPVTAASGDDDDPGAQSLSTEANSMRPTEVCTFAQLYSALRPGELLEGTEDRRFRDAWAMARADSFAPVG